jgi:hypothetical protein
MNQIVTIVLKAIVACINDVLALEAQPIPADPAVTPTADPAEAQPIPADPVVTPDAPIPPTADQVTPQMPMPDPADDLDSEQIPWDERIHSGGRTKYLSGDKAGQWKLKRGVAPVTVAQVKTELFQASGLPADPPAPEAPIVTSNPTVTPGSPIETWAQLVEAVTVKMLAPDTVQAACTKFNIENLGALQDVPIIIPMVAKELGV